MQKEWAESAIAEQDKVGKLERDTKRKKRKILDAALAEDMSLVTDDNVGDRDGWKRGRYGRAIAIFKMKANKNAKKVKYSMAIHHF